MQLVVEVGAPFKASPLINASFIRISFECFFNGNAKEKTFKNLRRLFLEAMRTVLLSAVVIVLVAMACGEESVQDAPVQGYDGEIRNIDYSWL